MLEVIGQARQGKLVFPPNAEELLTRLLSECEGKYMKCRYSRLGPHKTHKQCKTHFGLAVTMIREAMIDKGWSICGVAPSKDMIHEILLMSCGGVGELGQNKRLSEMTTDEASHFFENIRDWAATQLGIVIPDPDPRLKKCKE